MVLTRLPGRAGPDRGRKRLVRAIGVSAAMAAAIAAAPSAAQEAAAPVTPLAAPAPVQAPPGGLFGSLEFRGGSPEGIPQWQSVLERIEAEREAYRRCDEDIAACESPLMIAWRSKIRSLQGRFPLTQINEINVFVNEIVPYLEDSDNYGASDYWASPLEFMDNAGDCEDFAIMKFVSLLELGFTNDQMRVVVLEDSLRNVAHAVVAVRLEGENLILDSLFSVVLNDTQITQYIPQYSVNETTRWAHIVVPEIRSLYYARAAGTGAPQ